MGSVRITTSQRSVSPADAIDPSKRYFEEALRGGILSVHACQGNNTVISAVSRVVRPIGLTVAEMTVRADGGVKISFAPKRGYDRSAQMAILRETFAELDRYLEGLAEKLYEEDLKKKGEKLEVGPDEAAKKGKDLITLARIDDRHRNLVRLRKGRLDVFAWCAPRSEEIHAIA